MKNYKIWGNKVAALALMCVLAAVPAVSVAAEQTENSIETTAQKKEKTKIITKSKSFVEAVETTEIEGELEEEEKTEQEKEAPLYSAQDLKFQGVIWHDGHKFTWYSERALPGEGLNIPGRHADEDGYVCDEDDFICIATRDYEKGTEVDLPFGKKGKVYDWCPSSGTIDIYVNW